MRCVALLSHYARESAKSGGSAARQIMRFESKFSNGALPTAHFFYRFTVFDNKYAIK